MHAIPSIVGRALSLAKMTSDPPSWGARLCKDHSPRRTEVIGSITNRRIYSRSTVDCGGKRERFVSWRADQWFGRALTLLDGRSDGGGHRLREAARPARPPALRRASRGAQAMPDGSPSVGLAGQGLDRVEGGPRDRGSRHRGAVAARGAFARTGPSSRTGRAGAARPSAPRSKPWLPGWRRRIPCGAPPEAMANW